MRTESHIGLYGEYKIFLCSVTENWNFKAIFFKLRDINLDGNNFTYFSEFLLTDRRTDGETGKQRDDAAC